MTPHPFIKRMLCLLLATVSNYAGNIRTEPVQSRDEQNSDQTWGQLKPKLPSGFVTQINFLLLLKQILVESSGILAFWLESIKDQKMI